MSDSAAKPATLRGLKEMEPISLNSIAFLLTFPHDQSSALLDHYHRQDNDKPH